MDKLIKSGFIEIDEVFVVGNKELREENASSSETLHKITANTENVEDGEEKEVKIKIEKLEQLKIRLQNETQEMNRNATELSNEIISRANLDAKKIIDDAKVEAGNILIESKQNGFNQGYEESLERYEILLKEARDIIEDAEQYRKNTFANQEKEIIGLVLQCVNKILRQKLDDSDETATKLILSSIEDITSRKKLTVKVSREDFETTSKLKTKILAMFPAVEDIEIKIVETYLKGDMEIQSEDGTVNPSIKAQFVKLREEFSKLLEGE